MTVKARGALARKLAVALHACLGTELTSFLAAPAVAGGEEGGKESNKLSGGIPSVPRTHA